MSIVTQGLPRPEVSAAQAEELAREHFGIKGTAVELGSQQDRNYRIETSAGKRYVLKVNNPVFTRTELEAQNVAMAHLQEQGIAASQVLESRQGDAIVDIEVEGQPHLLRMLSWLGEQPLNEIDHISAATARKVGQFVGQVSLALAGFDHPGLERTLQWDLKQAGPVIAGLVSQLADPGRAAQVTRASEIALAQLAELAPQLPEQAIHGDLTDDNVMVLGNSHTAITELGAIDFGDVMRSWRVAELAVAASFVMHHNPGQPFSVLPMIQAFDGQVPLTNAEIAALWPLLVLRGCQLVVSGAQQMAIDPDNDYARNAMEREWAMFAEAAAIPAAVATAAIRHTLGRSASSATMWNEPSALAPQLTDVMPVDLGYDSRTLTQGDWLTPGTGVEENLVQAALAEHAAALLRFGEARLTRSGPPAFLEPENIPLFLELRLNQPLSLQTPVAGIITQTEPQQLEFSAANWRLVLRAEQFTEVSPDGGYSAQQPMAVAHGWMRVWLVEEKCGVLQQLEQLPTFVRATEALAWQEYFRDPLQVLTAQPVRPARLVDEQHELARRLESYAPLQHHYFDRPPQIERGWREYMIDTHGRHYVDMVNNVAAVGHAHPRLAKVVADQWLMLNTNSRFHYASLADFSERLLGTLPEGFDTVLLVNSGTEAVDLAMRIARAYSGSDDVMCVAESYHGWSVAADAVSTSTADNPIAEQTRPAWVHVADAPNAYRGTHQGPGAGAAYAADLRKKLQSLNKSGVKIGAFIAEPRNGNAGGVEVPEGYLRQVYQSIREQGGVCIADEVQVGYGRQGDVFWGYQQHDGVLPDIITVAKAMGNGHPLGAVITRNEIAEALSEQGSFFSSAGGSTLSARLGSEVFDIIAQERLQSHAAAMGQKLIAGFEALMEKHDLIGAIHGRGLYLGLEFVRDRETKEPATEETMQICDRLLQLGIMMQPTSERMNVFKIKPPMNISPESVEYFLTALDEVLSRGAR